MMCYRSTDKSHCRVFCFLTLKFVEGRWSVTSNVRVRLIVPVPLTGTWNLTAQPFKNSCIIYKRLSTVSKVSYVLR
jgi:hypothetical protein